MNIKTENKNTDLTKPVLPSDSELKDLIVNFVGTDINPENDEVTVEHIIDVFAEQFPEFLLAIAEENWVNGYTQALNDVEYIRDTVNNEFTNENGKEKIEETEVG